MVGCQHACLASEYMVVNLHMDLWNKVKVTMSSNAIVTLVFLVAFFAVNIHVCEHTEK